jgi:hypothetical protein
MHTAGKYRLITGNTGGREVSITSVPLYPEVTADATNVEFGKG